MFRLEREDAVFERFRPAGVLDASEAPGMEDFLSGTIGTCEADAPRSCFITGDVEKFGKGEMIPMFARASIDLVFSTSSRIVS